METRKTKNGGVSLLGFGLMRLPLKKGTQDIDTTQGIEMVDYALAHGVNYFDTAWRYHDGNSELFAGEALSRHKRDSYFLATKMPLMIIKTEEEVEVIFNEQLTKCRTDYFDFYLLHNITSEHLVTAKRCKVYEQLKKKQCRGQIRHLGFSFHDRPGVLQRVVDEWDWDFAQIQLNYIDWELQNAEEEYNILAEHQIPVNVMEPVRGGALASLCEEALAVFREADPAASAASWALRFAASLPGVATVLSGMSNLEQLQDNVNTFENFKPLNDGEHGIIEKALAAYRKAAAVPCTGCRYCVETGGCPGKVDIPRSLAIYNNYLRSGQTPMSGFIFSMECGILGEDHHPRHCITCGQCIPRCPQNIDIPHWMETINTLWEKQKTAPNPFAQRTRE